MNGIQPCQLVSPQPIATAVTPAVIDGQQVIVLRIESALGSSWYFLDQQQADTLGAQLCSVAGKPRLEIASPDVLDGLRRN